MQALSWSKTQCLIFFWFEFCNIFIDLLQLFSVHSLVSTTTGNIGNRLHHLQIERFFTGCFRVTDSDGVDGDLFTVGDFGGFNGGHLAAGIITIGQHDQHSIFCLAAFEQFDGQTDGVTKHGALPCHGDLGFI